MWLMRTQARPHEPASRGHGPCRTQGLGGACGPKGQYLIEFKVLKIDPRTQDSKERQCQLRDPSLAARLRAVLLRVIKNR